MSVIKTLRLMFSIMGILSTGFGMVVLVFTIDGIGHGALKMSSRYKTTEIFWEHTPEIFAFVSCIYLAAGIAAIWLGWRILSERRKMK